MSLDKTSRWAVIVIAFVAVASALNVGSNIFAPLTFGLVLGIVLSPFADFVDRIGLHRAISALVSIVLAVLLIAGLVLFIEPKVSYAAERAPQIMAELSVLIEGLRDLTSGIDDVRQEVSDALNDAEPADSGGEVWVPNTFDALSLAPSFFAQVLIVIGAFFFFLISRHEIYQWIARQRDGTPEGPSAQTLKNAERLVARYFLTITLINGSYGIILGVILHALGMPAPYVWAFAAAGLNYILYIGPAIFAASLLLGGLLAFDGAAGVLPALIYVGINAVEGNFVTPTLVGRNMQVNPLLIFLSLIFWLWMWGPLGGVVAIPILLYILAIVSGFGVSQTISFGTTGTSRPKRSAGLGS